MMGAAPAAGDAPGRPGGSALPNGEVDSDALVLLSDGRLDKRGRDRILGFARALAEGSLPHGGTEAAGDEAGDEGRRRAAPQTRRQRRRQRLLLAEPETVGASTRGPLCVEPLSVAQKPTAVDWSARERKQHLAALSGWISTVQVQASASE